MYVCTIVLLLDFHFLVFALVLRTTVNFKSKMILYSYEVWVLSNSLFIKMTVNCSLSRTCFRGGTSR